MVKVLVRAPPLPKDFSEALVTIKKAELVRDVRTSIGLVKLGLLLTLDKDGEEYSYLMSLDREIITGSTARLLSAVGITDTDELNEETLKRFSGIVVQIRNKGGRLFWFPVKVEKQGKKRQ